MDLQNTLPCMELGPCIQQGKCMGSVHCSAMKGHQRSVRKVLDGFVEHTLPWKCSEVQEMCNELVVLGER